MNEQLQAQISQILAQIMVSVGEVKDFSMEQLPDIAQQYITYGIWSSVFYLALSILVFSLSVFIFFKIKKLVDKDSDWIPAFSLPTCIGFFSLLAIFSHVHNLILVLTAPKVWFLLEIKNML